MTDLFDKKREMVHMLLDMLKGNATNEIELSIAKPKEMAQGGLVDTGMSLSDQASRLTETREQDADGSADEEVVSNLPGEIKDGPATPTEVQDEHNEEMVEDDQDNNESSFSAFLKRKKK